MIPKQKNRQTQPRLVRPFWVTMGGHVRSQSILGWSSMFLNGQDLTALTLGRRGEIGRLGRFEATKAPTTYSMKSQICTLVDDLYAPKGHRLQIMVAGNANSFQIVRKKVRMNRFPKYPFCLLEIFGPVGRAPIFCVPKQSTRGLRGTRIASSHLCAQTGIRPCENRSHNPKTGT